MPKSALPPELQDVENHFPDDKQYGDGFFGRAYTWFQKTTKPWTAFGPRATEKWAKWRDIPKLLWAKKGAGYWRFEADGKQDKWFDGDAKEWLKENPGYYLSRNQYWCVSHQAILWPLFHSFHKYKDPKDVLPVGKKDDRDGKIRMFYVGAKRDADRVFWFPAIYPGSNFK